MFTEQNIQQLIDQGENSAIEFKSSDVKPASLAKEMVGFANRDGGTIFIGVNDNGDIQGIPANKKWEEWAMNIARNNVNPSLIIEFQYFIIEEKTIAVINIPKGQNKPYQTQDGKFYIRVGSTNRITTIHELMRLFQESGVLHYDIFGIAGTNINSLNFAKIDKYFKQYNIEFDKEPFEAKIQLLKNTEILTEELTITIGGMLVFGTNPSEYLFQSGIMFAHFKGNHITSELIDRQEINGNIDFQIDTSLAIIKNNITVPSDIQGLLRVDKKILIPDKVYREIITNACIHRNYSISGSKIRIFMFDDRIEFMSPGKLPNSVTKEKICAGVSYARNPLIVKFMANLRYIDMLGRGIPMIIAEVTNANKKVTFEEFGEEFIVKLYII